MPNVEITIDAADRASGDLRNVETRLNNLDNASRNIDENAGSAATNMEQFGQKANLALDAVIIERGAQLATELYNIGENARTTSNTFDALTASAGVSANVMDELRARTRNVVDDTTLQAGANRLLMMGLVDNQDELVQTIGLITDLSVATGRDLSTAFQDFGALLANQSVLRLDNFGLSSTRVRERIEELQAAAEDLSDEDAFRMAVLEEGQRTLETVAPAIEQNITAIDRAEASAANLGSTLGENFAGNINAALTAVEQLAALPGLTAQLAEVDAGREVQAVADAMSTIDPSVIERLNAAGGDTGALDFFTRLQETTQTYEDFFGQAPQTMDVFLATLNEADLTPAEQAAADFWLAYSTGADDAVAAVQDAMAQTTAEASGAVDAITEQLQTLDGTTYTVRVRVELDDPNGVLGHASGTGGGLGIAGAVRNNGGTTPGADARTQRTGGGR